VAISRGWRRFFARPELLVLILLGVSWTVVGGVLGLAAIPGWPITLGLTVASGLAMLKLMGYFHELRLLPRRSDLPVMLVAVASGAGVARLLMGLLEAPSPLSGERLLLITLGVGVVTYGAHYGFSLLEVHRGRRLRFVLDVLPEERAQFIAGFERVSAARYIHFLTRAELAECLLRRAAHRIDLIIISRGALTGLDADATLLRAHLAGIPIIDHRRALADLFGRINTENLDVWTYLLEATPQTPLLRLAAALKRATEPLAAAVLAGLFLPVMGVLAMLIRLSSPGPVLYRQLRTGYLGRHFMLLKFRSMRVDAEADGPRWAGDNDDRCTPLGRFMRRTRLDELPQLLNVMRGEMGFLGPRPERPEIYRQLARDVPLFAVRTLVRPGITGWAQVMAGYAASIEESRTKLEHDLFYIQNMSPRLDLIILAKTLWVAVAGDARPAVGEGAGPTVNAAQGI